jgi:hypothetical protein
VHTGLLTEKEKNGSRLPDHHTLIRRNPELELHREITTVARLHNERVIKTQLFLIKTEQLNGVPSIFVFHTMRMVAEHGRHNHKYNSGIYATYS